MVEGCNGSPVVYSKNLISKLYEKSDGHTDFYSRYRKFQRIRLSAWRAQNTTALAPLVNRGHTVQQLVKICLSRLNRFSRHSGLC